MICRQQLQLTPMDAFSNNPLKVYISQTLINWLWMTPTKTLIVATLYRPIFPLFVTSKLSVNTTD